MAVKKLIEVALPLDAINAASAREKSIRHGHPSTLHLWWARRPLAAARAVIWSSLVDDEACKRIGKLYPKVAVSDAQGGGEATVIAWLWARTVTCPNPACGGDAILVRSFDLSKKKGKEWHVEPIREHGKVRFEVKPGKAEREGTVNRKGVTCVHCCSPFDFAHVREESRANRMGSLLMAVVAEGKQGRIYLIIRGILIQMFTDLMSSGSCSRTGS